MGKKLIHNKFFNGLVLVLLAFGCLDPYESPVSDLETDLLVVDGFLNSSKGEAVVKLTKATALATTGVAPVVEKAEVRIEGESGGVYSLVERSPGNYTGTGFSISTDQRYQLYIRTAAGKEYYSDLVELKQSPSLDSITWKPKPEGITIFANAHDVSGSTRFYQWVFTETWEYTSKYTSFLKLVNGIPVLRSTEEFIYLCWNTERSSQLLLGSTEQLSEDIVSEYPLISIPRGSPKLSRKYSILVQQRALTEEAYNFWLELEKTTENLGGLFDPMPSRVSGNIHNINDLSEPVLGYFSGGSVQEKRIFIEFYDLPEYLLYVPPSSCILDSLTFSEVRVMGPGYLLSNVDFDTGLYTRSTVECLDCRAAGGTVTKPAFWE